jgi:hypothetical protein
MEESAFVPWRSVDPNLPDAEYVPHPTPVCEPINLAATEAPELTYDLVARLPALSTMQRETVRAIMASLARRGTFLLGDGTGVGKGRTLAGLVCEYAAQSATPPLVVWVSANGRLAEEAKRELAIVGAAPDAVVFASYAAIINRETTRRLRERLLVAPCPLVILDECHLLRNKKCESVQALRAVLDGANARLVYSSATPFSNVHHLAYLAGLGLFGSAESPFADFDRLRSEVLAHGAAYMELLAMDMKARGAFVARQLSFAGVEVERELCVLTPSQRRVYDRCVEATRASGRVGSSRQRFFQKLITSLKAEAAIAVIERELANGHSVVVSLLNTGEAAARRTGPTRALPCFDDDESTLGHVLDVELPANPLDRLITHFGPDRVAELTGRHLRCTRRGAASGVWERERTPPLAAEADDFVCGRKHVAVVSRAGGTGISLHDKHDGRRRVHIILELPWSAEELLQQMGRTHRTDTARPPKYILLTTNAPAEMRFATSIAHKLQTFGALVKADRTSCSFPFARVPDWTPDDRRAIDLCLAAAEAMRDDDPPLPSCSRGEALAACGLSTRSSKSDRLAKARVAQALRQGAEDGDTQRRAALAGARRLYPQDLTMVFERWSPANHAGFPGPFRRQVVALLLCHAAWESRRTLGILPTDLLLVIVEHLARAAHPPALRALSRALRDHEGHARDLGAISTDLVLNRLLALELPMQEAFFAIADMVATSVPVKPSADEVQNYAAARGGPCVAASIDALDVCTFRGGAGGLRVRLAYSVAPPSAPPSGARFFRHRRGGQSAFVHDSTIVFDDGRSMHLADEAALAERDYEPTTRTVWDGAVHHRMTMAARRIKRQPSSIDLGTTNVLFSWEESKKRILRIRPGPRWPTGAVGLLMGVAA